MGKFGLKKTILVIKGKIKKDLITQVLIPRRYLLMTAATNKPEVPVWEKSCLTIDEAAAYFGIGTKRIRELTNDENCPYVLWVGHKRMIKRRLFDKFIEETYSI
jgi:excisionase family DNA binding protein